MRAECRAGEILAEMPKNRGAATRSHDGTAFKLSDVGVSKNESHRWQLMAEVREEAIPYIASPRENELERLSAPLDEPSVGCGRGQRLVVSLRWCCPTNGETAFRFST